MLGIGDGAADSRAAVLSYCLFTLEKYLISEELYCSDKNTYNFWLIFPMYEMTNKKKCSVRKLKAHIGLRFQILSKMCSISHSARGGPTPRSDTDAINSISLSKVID